MRWEQALSIEEIGKRRNRVVEKGKLMRGRE